MEVAYQTAKLSNSINAIGMKAFNSLGTINRTDILSSYSKEALERAWIAFTNFICKNYQSGRGTYVKGFGTFTYTNVEYSLEGTTNQYVRDVKLRKPVFIVSPDFVENLKPGQYTKTSGLIYYTQKPNNSISIVRLNIAELAFGINVSKEEYNNILNQLLQDLGNQIRAKTFRKREMPGIGTLMTRGNVIGVKFISDFAKDVQKIPQKLIHTKKNIGFYMDTYKTNGAPFDDLPNAEQAMEELRPKTSVITHLIDNGEKWLGDNMEINYKKDVMEADQSKVNDYIENWDHKSKFNSATFFYPQKKKVVTKATVLKDLCLPKEVLEGILACKGQIIKEMKFYDKRNNGIIARFEVIRAISKSNVHPKLSMDMIKDIVDVYGLNIECIDYFKMVTCLLKDIKIILKQKGSDSDSELHPSFNNKFKLGPKPQSRSTSSSSVGFGNKTVTNFSINTLSCLNNYDSLLVNVDDVENEIKSIKVIFKRIMPVKGNAGRQPFPLDFYNQVISFMELSNILHKFTITITSEKLLKVLKYIGMPNPSKFTLYEFNNKLTASKVTSYEMTNNDIIEAYNNLVTIIKNNGGKQLLFDQGQTLSLDNFIKKLKPKTNYSSNVLTILFSKIAKNKPALTLNDFVKEFETSKEVLNDRFYEDSLTRMRQHVKAQKISINEYFNHLLGYNYCRDANKLRPEHFVLAMQQEGYKPEFSESELNFIFKKMDANGDGLVDRVEFQTALFREQDALIKMQDIIKRLELTVTDLAYRLEISKDKEEFLTFYPFKVKMKKFDYTYTNEFIEGLYTELAGGLDKSLSTKVLLEKFDVYRRENFLYTNNETFKKNFISNIQTQVDYHNIKKSFEDMDKEFTGRISKEAFCKVIKKVTNEFRDEDMMKFVRICQLTDPFTYEVIYSDFLNLIYFNPKLDLFLLCVNELKKELEKNSNNLNQLIASINKTVNSKEDWISIDNMFTYLRKLIGKDNGDRLYKNVVAKFDLDSDGKIGYDDLKGIVYRYISTSFFKYENNEKSFNVNLYADDTISDAESKAVIRKIKAAIKKKNVNDIGLFKKLDEDHDGFISNHEFNKNISQIVTLDQSMKDKIFNYLDYYHNGLVDLQTFLLRFKEFKSNEIIIHNDSKIEKDIIALFSEWISKTSDRICDTELFSLMDHDNDGLIGLDDFRYFVLDTLGISKNEFNDFKLERVMQTISLTGNKNIGLGDIREFMNKSLANNLNSYYVDLKETFKETTNQNLSKLKKNNDWHNQAIERFGMFLSEKYPSIEAFYNTFCDKESGKFKYENFEEFHHKNYDCFYGFNLTKDELLAIFTSLDSQKKNYLTLEDFKNKLNLFDFFKKMHFDIKLFLQTNFKTNVDAFKYFFEPSAKAVIGENTNFRHYITKKEFFEGINHLFPQKYSTPTVLKYYQKYFNIGTVFKNGEFQTEKDSTQISFYQFSFVYYDKVIEPNEEKMTKTFNNSFSKISTSRSFQFGSARNSFSLPNHPFETLPHKTLITPFDKDPLEKIRRIIESSNGNYLDYIRMQVLITNGVVNQFEFRNIIKHLNIGLTNIEIEDIIKRAGKTRDGRINLNDFYKFVSNGDKNLNKAHGNIKLALGEIKQLLYKYYSNPKLAFEFADGKKINKIDFDKFKSIVSEMYKRESRQVPNFTLLKNVYDFIDLRKDGVIDMNEWTNSFGRNAGKLDLLTKSRQVKALRQWETSDNVMSIYKDIAKSRKLIWDKAKKYSFNKAQGAMIHEDNLIAVLKDFFPKYNLTNTQWRMIVEIADRDSSKLIEFDLFIKIVEHCALKEKSHPKLY